jgi:hypothetical protein
MLVIPALKRLRREDQKFQDQPGLRGETMSKKRVKF